MEELLKKINDNQKNELINALYKANEILEEVSDEIGDNSEYYKTKFYDGLWDLMNKLGQWC